MPILLPIAIPSASEETVPSESERKEEVNDSEVVCISTDSIEVVPVHEEKKEKRGDKKQAQQNANAQLIIQEAAL